MKTYSPKPSDIQRSWHVVDASGQTLGRLVTRVATLLRGKHKPIYAPHMDVGDYVIVLNAGKVVLTGRKLEQKRYYRYSGYPGGLKEIKVSDELARRPERVIEHAVKGMLPKGPLGRQMFRKLRVYRGATHPHQGQVNAPRRAAQPAAAAPPPAPAAPAAEETAPPAAPPTEAMSPEVATQGESEN